MEYAGVAFRFVAVLVDAIIVLVLIIVLGLVTGGWQSKTENGPHAVGVNAEGWYLVAAIAVWSSPKRQRIGDRAAATVVVHDRGEFRESVQSRRPAYDLPEYPRADDSTVYAQERFLEDLARAKCFGD
jgi:hypothetical protein